MQNKKKKQKTKQNKKYLPSCFARHSNSRRVEEQRQKDLAKEQELLNLKKEMEALELEKKALEALKQAQANAPPPAPADSMLSTLLAGQVFVSKF